jgi:hypothetical protein
MVPDTCASFQYKVIDINILEVISRVTFEFNSKYSVTELNEGECSA